MDELDHWRVLYLRANDERANALHREQCLLLEIERMKRERHALNKVWGRMPEGAEKCR